MFWPGLASAGLSALAFLGTVFFLPESLPKESRKPFASKADAASDKKSGSAFAVFRTSPVLLSLVFASLFVAIAGGAMQSVFQFWGRDLFNYSLRDIGLHFTAFALFSAVGQAGLVGPLSKRFGEKRVAVASALGVTAGLVLFSVATNAAMVWVAISVFGLANGLFLPAITSLVSFQADPSSRGAVMGIFNSSSSAGRIFGPALSGPVYFNMGPAAPFALSALLTIVGVLLLSRLRSKPKN